MNSVRAERLDVRGFTSAEKKYREIAQDGGVLIGLDVGLGKDGVGKATINALRPIFRTAKGEAVGKWCGPVPAKPTTIKAKSGYVVAGISIQTDAQIRGLSLRFAKLGQDGLHEPHIPKPLDRQSRP